MLRMGLINSRYVKYSTKSKFGSENYYFSSKGFISYCCYDNRRIKYLENFIIFSSTFYKDTLSNE